MIVKRTAGIWSVLLVLVALSASGAVCAEGSVAPPIEAKGSLCAGMSESLRPVQVQRPSGMARSSLEFRLVVRHAGPGTIGLPEPNGTPLVLASPPVLTEHDITKTEVGPALETLERFWKGLGPLYYVVELHLTPEGARRLHKVSNDNLGGRMALVVAGRISLVFFMHTTVDSPVLIEGSYTCEDATRLAGRLAP
jgi:hypothetical protein